MDPNNPNAATRKKHVMSQIRQIRKEREEARKLMELKGYTFLPHNSNGKRIKNERAKTAKKYNNAILARHHTIHVYITPIVTEIRNQLTIVQRILYKLQFTREYVNDWTLDNVDILQRVKQTLLNALHIILYPKEKHPKLYNSPEKKIVFSLAEHKKINIFFEPIITLIHTERANIVIAKGKTLNPKTGEVYGYLKKPATELNTVDTAFLEVLTMISQVK
jgi:hypothetical protein